MADNKQTRPEKQRSDFLDSLWKGALLGAVALAIALPWLRSREAPTSTAPAPTVAVAPAPGVVPPPSSGPPATDVQSQSPSLSGPQEAAPQVSPPVVQLPPEDSATSPSPVPQAKDLRNPAEVLQADFGTHEPSRDARRMANWIVQSSDNKKRSFVIVDKKDARVYVFDGKGRMQSNTPALMGSARGDDSAPGIGDKPLSQVTPEEKTTPAGRFVAELGFNTQGEDIVWVDYDAAVSLHRVRANNQAERRLERLASTTPRDNRISFGCINLPKSFYERVLQPTVKAGQTIVYVLPETRPLHKTFPAFREPSISVAQR